MTTMNKRNGGFNQILPICELKLSIGDHTYIKVVATGKTQMGRYKPFTEYWRTRDLADFSRFDRDILLDMTVSTRADGEEIKEEEIEKFFEGYGEEVSWSETVPFYGWQRFSYTAPQIITPYLFSTPDLDLTTRQARLGMSLLIDKGDKLQGVGWHKTFSPSNGYIWKTAPEDKTVVQFSLDGWTTDPWTVPEGSGYPMTSWWYAINYNPPK